MTVQTETRKISHVSDNVQTSFTYDFLVYLATHMAADVDGVTVSPGTITVNDLGNPDGGTVDFNPAPPAGTLTLIRTVPLTQLILYSQDDPFPSKTHERGLDLAMMAIQQVDEQTDRTLIYDVTQTPTQAQRELPTIDELKGKVLTWDLVTGELSAGEAGDFSVVVTTPYTRGFLTTADELAALTYLNAAGVNLANVFSTAQTAPEFRQVLNRVIDSATTAGTVNQVKTEQVLDRSDYEALAPPDPDTLYHVRGINLGPAVEYLGTFAASAGVIAIDSILTSVNFSHFIVDLQDLILANNGATLQMRHTVAGAAHVTADYDYGHIINSAGATAALSALGSTQLVLNNVGSYQLEVQRAVLNIEAKTLQRGLTWEHFGRDAANTGVINTAGGGRSRSAVAAFDGIVVFAGPGNIDSGSARVYGFKNV